MRGSWQRTVVARDVDANGSSRAFFSPERDNPAITHPYFAPFAYSHACAGQQPQHAAHDLVRVADETHVDAGYSETLVVWVVDFDVTNEGLREASGKGEGEEGECSRAPCWGNCDHDVLNEHIGRRGGGRPFEEIRRGVPYDVAYLPQVLQFCSARTMMLLTHPSPWSVNEPAATASVDVIRYDPAGTYSTPPRAGAGRVSK